MTIDPAAIVALLSDLTQQIARLEQENAQLREAVAAQGNAEPTG